LALRLVFMGTPDFAVPTLTKILASDHKVAAVYTRPAKPAGRKLELTPSPIALKAERSSLPVFTPKTLRDAEAAAQIRGHSADAAVVVAYGLILPKAILDAFALGCFNLHASLLPRWRGAAPIQRAIMAGDPKTGVMVMKMDEGLDTGRIARRKSIKIGTDETAGDLHDKLAGLGADLMLDALNALVRETLRFKRQPAEGITYANKISKDEAHINWARPWNEVHNHIRGLSPFPGAWFELSDVGRIKLLRTTKGDGAVRLVELQRAGRQPMRTEEFLRGTTISPGTCLNSKP